MTADTLKIEYKIYLEAEDVSQSRILSTASFVKNLFRNCSNTYFNQAEVDDESELEDFTLRLYADESIEETVCSAPEDAKNFPEDMAAFLDAIALAHSFLDMEGSFAVEYEGEKRAYAFRSDAGDDGCDFFEQA